jgi:hypothetical protein
VNSAGGQQFTSVRLNCLCNQSHLTILSDDILEGGLPKFRNGCLTLPEGPGLGVELDRKRVTKYAKYFDEHGEFPATEPLWIFRELRPAHYESRAS